MKTRRDLIPLMRHDQTPPSWAIYSFGKATWLEGSYKSFAAADNAARLIEKGRDQSEILGDRL
ncbi:MAG TPA: hypothetical protein VM900_13410 [Sphingomonas sp.]|jgi:hypothetical protein|nr:hypothetical protein [Sphingomonas sp.]